MGYIPAIAIQDGQAGERVWRPPGIVVLDLVGLGHQIDREEVRHIAVVAEAVVVLRSLVVGGASPSEPGEGEHHTADSGHVHTELVVVDPIVRLVDLD